MTIEKIVEKHITEDTIPTGMPKFILLTGGVGSGKTSYRREKFSSGYVAIDGEEILKDITVPDLEDIEEYLKAIDIVGSMLAEMAIATRRNIIMELVGSDMDKITGLLSLMESKGYEVQTFFIDLNPKEAYKRHLKAVEDDPTYLSCYFTQDLHLKWITDACEKYD